VTTFSSTLGIYDETHFHKPRSLARVTMSATIATTGGMMNGAPPK